MRKILQKTWRRHQQTSSAQLPKSVHLSIGESVSALHGEYVGHIDNVGNGIIAGWAASKDDKDKHQKVRLYVDGLMLAEGIADGARPDVAAAGYGSGQHGYSLRIPKKSLMCGKELTLKVLTEGGQEVICEHRVLSQPAGRANPVIYMDASDLIEFLTHHRELSGIQRVQAGYLLGLGDKFIDRRAIKICTRFKYSSFYFAVSYEWLAELLRFAGDAKIIANSAWGDYINSSKSKLTTRAELIAGDIIFTLGAPWALDDHNETIRCAKVHNKAFYAQVFYDLIPISVPEVVAEPLIPHFSRAMAAMAIYADHIFSISKYSESDLENTLIALSRTVPPTSVIPMGGTITDSDQLDVQSIDIDNLNLVRDKYVLCVGTLEPRKNHFLLLQAWRILAARHGVANIPKLVLVGRVGWYMEDFMRQLKISNYVGNSIVHLQGISNRKLSKLYDDCLFTVFPSFSEGWGLPITESLARGKICVCSNVTSMPEAGSSFATYIDPYNTTAATSVFERLIFDKDFHKMNEANIRNFKADTWAEASGVLHKQLTDLSRRLDKENGFSKENKFIEFGKTYRFDNIDAKSSDRTSKMIFENFLQQEEDSSLLVGWNWFDTDIDCTWSCGDEASLELMVPPDSGSVDAYVGMSIPQAFADELSEIYINDIFVSQFRAASGSNTFCVPLGDEGGRKCIKFKFVGKRQKMEDQRLLSYGLMGVTVYQRKEVADFIKIIRAGQAFVI